MQKRTMSRTENTGEKIQLACTINGSKVKNGLVVEIQYLKKETR